LRLDHCFVKPKNEDAEVIEVDVGGEKKKIVMAPGKNIQHIIEVNSCTVIDRFLLLAAANIAHYYRYSFMERAALF
jgi:hypothetical protein